MAKQKKCLEFTLLDDGTLDTVVEITCRKCGKTWEERFNGKLASYYRDPDTGEMLRLADLVADMGIYCECEEK